MSPHALSLPPVLAQDAGSIGPRRRIAPTQSKEATADKLGRLRSTTPTSAATTRPNAVLVAATLCGALSGPPAFAIPAAVQDFEGGTTAGWVSGGPLGVSAPGSPVVVGNGRAGANDHYLQVTAIGGSGPGSRLATSNRSAWDGDYATAGLNTISMDLRNFGTADIYVRLVLFDLSDLTQPNWASSPAAFLPAGSDWMSKSFSLAVADLVGVFGDANELLRSITEIRIMGFANASATFALPGTNTSSASTTQLGVDNIAPNVFGTGGNGNPVPVPSTVSLLLLGVLAARFAVTRRSS